MERCLILLMLWKYRRSTFGLGECFQITTHLLPLKSLRKRRKRVFLKSIHLLFLRG
jgi:hypothetical protein